MEPIKANLHGHSTFSDSSRDPLGYIVTCANFGLKYAALTDHDTTKGWEKLFSDPLLKVMPNEQGDFRYSLIFGNQRIEFFPGIEMTSILTVDGKRENLHITGLGISRPDRELRELFKKMSQERFRRIREIVDEVRRKYEPGLTMDGPGGVAAIIGQSECPSRLHVGKALYDINPQYHVSPREAMRRFVTKEVVSEEAFNYNRTIFPSAQDAIGRIKALRGIPILAHPHRIKFNLESALEQLIGFGIEGVETFIPEDEYSSLEQKDSILRTIKAAEEKYDVKLINTAANDTHGDYDKHSPEKLFSIGIPMGELRGMEIKLLERRL